MTSRGHARRTRACQLYLARSAQHFARLSDEAQLSFEVALRARADRRSCGFAVLEQDHHRDRHDAVASGETLVLVDVDLHELQRSFALVGNLLEHGRDGVARAAPFGPEVDEDGGLLRALDHFALERVLGDLGCHSVQVPFFGFLWLKRRVRECCSRSLESKACRRSSRRCRLSPIIPRSSTRSSHCGSGRERFPSWSSAIAAARRSASWTARSRPTARRAYSISGAR